MSYGSDIVDVWRRPSAFVDRLLRGAKVVDLPVEFPTKFELVINLRAANAIGLTLPPTLVARADEVIGVASTAGDVGPASGRAGALSSWPFDIHPIPARVAGFGRDCF